MVFRCFKETCRGTYELPCVLRGCNGGRKIFSEKALLHLTYPIPACRKRGLLISLKLLLKLALIERFVKKGEVQWKAAKRPAFPALHSQAFKAGYSQRGAVELNLGGFVGTILADPDSYSTR